MNSISFWCIFWTLLYQVQSQATTYQCGIRKHSFVQLVYHGWRVEEGQWPWHVAILHKSQQNGTGYACGGSLIGPNHVLTAAHCVVNRRTNNPLPIGSFLLYFGTNDLTTMAKHVQMRDVRRVHVHPEFTTHRNDIAVLELRLSVEFTDVVIPICLDTRVDRDLRELEGRRGWITGWGMTQNGSVSSELRSASLPVVSYLQCFQDDQTLFGGLLNPNVFCAGDRNGTSPGTGDSGGGMFFSDGDRWVLRGIVSFAKVDESRLQVDTSKYAVFVNVQRFLSWIREVTEDRNSDLSARSAVERISEIECDRFKTLVRKRANGICSNARYPHTVSLVYADGTDKCSGVLVNEYSVLTACHCTISEKFKPLMVRIADYGTVSISSTVCPADYNRPKYYHDIAIVKLDSPVPLSFNIVPACLASNWTENLYDTLLTTGFRKSVATGVMQFYESDANQVVLADECNRRMRKTSKSFRQLGLSTAHQLCVMNNEKLPSSSEGSSGALLQTVNTRSCMFTAVGVLSHGTGRLSDGDRTANDTLLDVFTRVSGYLDWIEENVWGNEKAVASGSTTTMTSTMTTAATTTTENPSYINKDFVFPSD